MKYSHQRELVKEIIKGRSDHPTVDMVYTSAREIEPTISLGTVYRNVKSLAESGEVDSLETVDKRLHYDGNTKKHGHFICTACHKIFDIWVEPTAPKVISDMGFTVTETKCVYYGLCDKCKTAIEKSGEKSEKGAKQDGKTDSNKGSKTDSDKHS